MLNARQLDPRKLPKLFQMRELQDRATSRPEHLQQGAWSPRSASSTGPCSADCRAASGLITGGLLGYLLMLTSASPGAPVKRLCWVCL